jgi:hypothetical protein
MSYTVTWEENPSAITDDWTRKEQPNMTLTEAESLEAALLDEGRIPVRNVTIKEIAA